MTVDFDFSICRHARFIPQSDTSGSPASITRMITAIVYVFQKPLLYLSAATSGLTLADGTLYQQGPSVINFGTIGLRGECPLVRCCGGMHLRRAAPAQDGGLPCSDGESIALSRERQNSSPSDAITQFQLRDIFLGQQIYGPAVDMPDIDG